jgi:hypothetical protein
MLKKYLYGNRVVRLGGMGFAAGLCAGFLYLGRDWVLLGLGKLQEWVLAGGNFLLLVIGYSITWFLGCALIFILWGRKGGSMALPMATVMGILTAILHAIVCHFIGNPCKF